jgi:hypothetical protein
METGMAELQKELEQAKDRNLGLIESIAELQRHLDAANRNHPIHQKENQTK